MICGVCDCSEVFIRSTQSEKDTVYRRRECTRCGHRWNTVEIRQHRMDELTTIERHAKDLAEAVFSRDRKS